MKYLLSILSLVSIGAFGQTFTPVPGTNQTVTIGGSQFKVKVPFDYATCDSTKLFFQASFGGDGETTAASTENTVMGKWVKSGGPWNSHILLNNGDTARVIVMSIPAYGNQPLLYGNAIKTAILSCTRLGTGAGGTTPIPGHFSLVSLSGGVGRIASWQNNDTTQVRTLFKRGLFMSGPVITSSFGWSSGGNWFVGWSRNDNPSGGTPPSASSGFYTNLQGTKDSMSFGGSLCGHCSNLWDSIATVHGLNSHTGGTALTNRIRRLIDPNDGLSPTNQLPVANAGADQQITLPTNSVTVSGTSSFDPDGSISSYAWTKISGPATFTIVSASSSSTVINNLVAGTYVFRLTVTDNSSATDPDDVTITVNNPPVNNYVVGQLFQKTHSGETFLVYLPDTAQRVKLKQYFIFSMADSSGKDSAYITSRALGKKIINGWNGKQALTNGDTAVFNIVILMSNPTQKNSMETAIQWALDSIPNQCFDTASRTRNIMTGIGRAAADISVYLLNEFAAAGQGGTLKFRHNWGKYTSIDHRDNGRLGSNNWDEIKVPFKSWWIAGGSNSYPFNTTYTNRGYDSTNNYNPADSVSKYKIISGAAYSSVTWDSVYSSLGTGSENNMFRWWADDIEFGFPGDKIPVGKYHYADLSGADGLAAKNTWYYFDSEWDIKEGNTNTVDTTDGKTYAKSAIMHRRFGQRDVWINFQKPFVVTAVYGKRRNSSTDYPDTVTFYSRGSRINNLTFLAADKRTRNDYLFRAISIGNSTAWEKVWEGKDTTQYLLINLRRNTYTEPFTQGTDGNYQDFVFYGYELPGGTPETKYNIASEEQLDEWANTAPKATLRSHSGANFSNIYMVRDYRNIGIMRGYNNQQFHWTGKYPYNTMKMQLRADSTGWVWHNSQVIAEEPDKFSYTVLNGTNKYVVDTQSKRLYAPDDPLYGSDAFKPTDTIGMDAAYPQHYKTFASNATFQAELFGFDNVKNMRIRVSQDTAPPPGAYKLFRGFEMGNENDIDVHDSAYMYPLERAANWWAVWDGFLGTMNTGDSAEFGVHLADPTMKVITDATVGWNYKPLCAAILCAKIMAQSDTLPFNMVATHLYHSNTKVNPGVPSSITNLSAHGIPPEMFGYPDDIDTMVRVIRKFIKKPPSQIQLTNNEWGYDVTYQRPQCSSGCDTNFFNTTSYGLPYQNIGIDSSYWASILLGRGMFIFWASGYDQSVIFTFNNDHNPKVPGRIFPYSKSGINGYYHRNPETFNVDSVTYEVAATHLRGVMQRFADYKHVQTIDKTPGDRWVMRGVHKTNSDTSLYVIWEGDSLQSGVSYNIPVASGKAIKEWISSTTNINGSEVMRTPTGGTYTANAGLEQKFFLVYSSEGAPENQSPTAAAGANQSITLPTSQVTVNGSSSSDPDGTINTYLWTKISGPATFTITNSANASTTITGLVQGTYVFRLTVTDDDGAQDTDDIQITVGAAPVVPGNRRQYFRGSLRLNKFRNL